MVVGDSKGLDVSMNTNLVQLILTSDNAADCTRSTVVSQQGITDTDIGSCNWGSIDAEQVGVGRETGLFPEQTLPGGEVRSLEQCMFQNALHTSERLNHVRP